MEGKSEGKGYSGHPDTLLSPPALDEIASVLSNRSPCSKTSLDIFLVLKSIFFCTFFLMNVQKVFY